MFWCMTIHHYSECSDKDFSNYAVLCVFRKHLSKHICTFVDILLLSIKLKNNTLFNQILLHRVTVWYYHHSKTNYKRLKGKLINDTELSTV